MSQNNNTNTVPNKAEAKADQAIGSAKETFGNAAGNSELESQGAKQNAHGHGKEEAHDIAGIFNKISHEVEGTVKGVFNAISGKK
ncbi:uncharacterized protein EV154DRAFT_425026 [Mucor mucedo]|uniref:uncharacterized protein n=1 Tax=Mucor mucedo TaxID=29922 RepID=UPI00221EA522|nr:uncharacterized protein EV154DRAFT_425026 [Mucor mucedo]KAI7888802.1 hypothetical protein EV154DRAFT_425026 [Mucor mucedo]